MDPASAAAGSIGIPPLNLSQGPSTALAETQGNAAANGTTGDFVFKGSGRGGDGLNTENIFPLLLIAGLGGAAWLIYKRFT